MKKLIAFISIIVLVLTFSGCGKKEAESKYGLFEIDYTEFKEKVEDEESFFVEIIQDGCSACQSFTPKLQAVLEEYEIKAYKLNISDMNESDYKEFNSEYSVSGTPEVIFLKNGQEETKMQRITSNISKTKIVSKLKANGIIETEEDSE